MSGLPAQIRYCIAAFACLVVCALPAMANATTSGGGTATASTGGTSPDDPQFQPHGTATLLPNGQAIAPTDAPPEVQAMIAAGNKIATLPYVYGGGHNATFSGRGYDCSGSVSYALHGGGLLTSPLDSSSFMKWGQKGPGSWVTIYTNPGHAYMVVAGLRFDTSMRTPIVSAARKSARRAGTFLSTRWSTRMRPSDGYVIRHPAGF
jgi:cell wall-associated NlpC family hydrolase